MSQPALGRLILSDIGALKLRWTLALATMVSAFVVVQLAYENRQMTSDLDSLREQRDELAIERRHLMLEESALAEHSRVNRVAKQTLDMERPSIVDKTLVDVK